MATTTARTTTLTILGKYTEHGVIPPRCRTPRNVTVTASTQVTIPCATSDQAPLAFIIRTPEGVTRPNQGNTLHIREFSGSLYEEETDPQGNPVTQEDFTTRHQEATSHHWPVQSQEGFDAAVAKDYDGYLFIDGTVWSRTGEPRYKIQYTITSSYVIVTRWDDPAVCAYDYFRADHSDEARQAVEDYNRQVGVVGAPFLEEIEVLRPEAVTLVVPNPGTLEEQEVRGEYHDVLQDAFRLRSVSTQEEVKRADELRAALGRVIRAMERMGVSAAEPAVRPYEVR